MQSTPILLLIPLLFCTNCLASTLYYRQEQHRYRPGPDEGCKLSVAETIPENLTFSNSTVPKHLSTFAAYQFLVGAAVKELKVASLYWSLQGCDIMRNPGDLAAKGEQLFSAILNRSHEIPIRLANNIGGLAFNHSDLQLLAQQPNVGLVWVNISGLLGGGVQHTKLMLADGKHAYLGSSNIDWRSLTQVKELGLLMRGCSTLVRELDKIFEAYWLVGKENQIPATWPASLTASINATNPWVTSIGNYKYSIYFGVSPAQLTPPSWSRDIDGILDAILSARQFVHIAVMDYQAEVWNDRSHTRKYWGVIDDALRTAVFRGVKVRLLVSHWKHSNIYVKLFMDSLTALNGRHSSVEGKFFVVPAFTDDQRRIPYARVNHNKYMVTEDTAVVCTSNWEGSYFTSTTGVALIVKQLSGSSWQPHYMDSAKDPGASAPESSIVEQIQAVFQRDWTSEYAHTRVPV